MDIKLPVPIIDAKRMLSFCLSFTEVTFMTKITSSVVYFFRTTFKNFVTFSTLVLIQDFSEPE